MNLERDVYRERMFLKGLILLLTAWFLGTFFWVALQRIGYPYELASTEGGAMLVVERVIEGRSIYTEPSLEWLSPDVTPLYYYISAFFSYIFGESITILRLISLVCTVCTGLLFYRFLRNTGVEDSFAIAGFGLFFASYSVTGAWYDLAAPDSLAIFLAFAAIFIAGWGQGWFKAVLSGCLGILAFFTMQEFGFIWLLLLVFWWFTNRKSLKIFGLSSVVLLVAGLLALHLQSDGKSWFYIFIQPFNVEIKEVRFFTFWIQDLLLNFPLMAILSAAALYGLFRLLLKERRKVTDAAMGVLILGFIGVSLVNRLSAESFANCLIPAAIALAGLSAWTLQHFHTHDYNLGWFLPVLVKSMVVLQFIILLYKPQQYIPSEADSEAGNRLISRISSFDGEVLIPRHNYFARLANKKTYADWNNLSIKKGNASDAELMNLPSGIMDAILDKSFTAIILDEPESNFKLIIDEYYIQAEIVFEDSMVFWSKAGIPTRPQFIYYPR
ncbi:MAG: glycosyltransferase family 39 protein [candidate division Zixibacteria bacterium]|nr:glycosyltransferase family 39 protein [Candidatus Tariuqbacter arcticus]